MLRVTVVFGVEQKIMLARVFVFSSTQDRHIIIMGCTVEIDRFMECCRVDSDCVTFETLSNVKQM